jgi:RNA recognition motif-containing protein
VDCNLVRDKKTGESRGFAFIAYEDTRSCVMAVDNFNGSKVLNRVMRVDHVLNYRRPKKEQKVDKKDEEKDDIELPSEDEDYDERRKAIWDYSLYQDRYEEVASDDDVPELDDEPVKAAEAPAPNAVQSHIDAVRAKRRARMSEAVNMEKQAGFALYIQIVLFRFQLLNAVLLILIRSRRARATQEA